MICYDGVQILKAQKDNPLDAWHSVGGSRQRSSDPRHASNRIWREFADLGVDYKGPRLRLDDPVFAMGSCFAREMERALRANGGKVVSIDDRVERDEFRNPKGSLEGFFNRFTPWAMWQEFKRCFDEMPGWSEQALIYPLNKKGEEVADLHHWVLDGSPMSLEATLTRRRIARDLVREAAGARLIVLTLGLIESWYHKPSGLYVNRPQPLVLARRAEEFELRVMEYDDVLACLEDILDLLKRRHVDGDFQLVVTVSPVPLWKTFTDKDVVIANTESKATLRAAAGVFARRHERAHYFPSYEMVTLSHPKMAWSRDRLHVQGDMVRWVINHFMAAYYSEPPVVAGVEEDDDAAMIA